MEEKTNSNSNDSTKKEPYVYVVPNSLNSNDNSINSDNISNDNNLNTKYDSAGYIALYLSLILVGVLLICFIFSGGKFDEQDGIVWLFAGIYFYLGELPVVIASVVFGIKGLRSNNKLPSYISFIINLLKLLFVVIVMR